MALRKVDDRTLSERVYDELLHSINSGVLFLGESLSLKKIAADLGVSMMPVREALSRLASERIVVIHPKKGIYVNSLTPEEILEAFSLRKLLETRMAQVACRSRSEEAPAAIAEILEEMSNAAKSIKEILVLNYRFHFYIYRYSGMSLTMELTERLWGRVGPIFHFAVERMKTPDFAFRHHREICDAFRERDARRMRKGLLGDIQNTLELVMSASETLQKRSADSGDLGGGHTVTQKNVHLDWAQ